MSEWLKEHAWKACSRAIVTWVRIPPSPPPYAQASGGGPRVTSVMGDGPHQWNAAGSFCVGCLPKLLFSEGRLAPMWYFYFLQLRNNDAYVGSRNDLRRRLSSHQTRQVLSTKQNLPARPKSYVAVETGALARELERYFKSGSGKAFANKRFWKSLATASGLRSTATEYTPRRAQSVEP